MLSTFRQPDIRATIGIVVALSVFIGAVMASSVFPWLVFWPAFGIAAFFIFSSPRAGLFATLFLTMIWERFFTLEPLIVAGRAFKLYPLDIVLMLTALALFAHWLFAVHTRRILHGPHAQSPTLLAAFGAFEKSLIVFSLLATAYFFVSEAIGVREPDVAFSTFKNYTFYALLTFLILGLIRTPNEYRQLISVLLAGGAGIIVFILIGLFRGQGLWTEYVPLSTEGVRYLAFPHSFYTMVVMLLLVSAVAHRAVRQVRAVSLCIALEAMGLIGSLMRHLWIAFFLGVGVLFLLAPRMAKRYFLRWGERALLVFFSGVIVLAVATIFFPASAFGTAVAAFRDAVVLRIESLQHIRDISALWRLRLWSESVGLFLSHPFFGIGFGREVVFTFQEWTSVVRIRELHNSFLSMILQIGIVGTGLFLFVQGVFVREYFRRRRTVGVLRPWSDGAFSAYVAFLFAALFQPYIEINMVGIFFWVLLGMVRVAPFLQAHPSFDASYLGKRRYVQALEGRHTRGQHYV